MPFRMSRTLKFWVAANCAKQDIEKADWAEVAAILHDFESRGYAMRVLNRRGEITWRETPQMVARLADAEDDCED